MSEAAGAAPAVVAAGGAPAVVATNVRKHFDGGLVRALDGLTLVVPTGQLVAITGPSGCGKSTLLHLLAALDSPTSGSLQVGGVDLAHLADPPRFRREQVGLVFQLHNLLPHLSAAENVEIAMFGTGRRRVQRRARARQLLADVDLVGREDRPPTRLSGGERQRVAIARALANEPQLLLADEPTGSLDARSVRLVLDLLRRLRQDRPALTILVVTHDPTVAAVADRVVRVQDGRVVEDRTAAPPVVAPPGSR